jgi:hypothetical protein
MKTFFLTAISVVLLYTGASAQYSVVHKDKNEIGISAGFSNYQGDLTENFVNYESTEGFAGIFYRHNFIKQLSLRIGGDFGAVSADDKRATAGWRKNRNLNFYSNIEDFYMVPEWNILTKEFDRRKQFTLYVFGGIGVFHFNPQGYYKGQYYDLAPLSTEGEGLPEYSWQHPYKLTQFYVPFGMGMSCSISQTWKIGLEVRCNKTYTDYLDDVSTTYVNSEYLTAAKGPLAAALADRTGEVKKGKVNEPGSARGNDKTYDWYFFTGITLSHSFSAKGMCYKF